MASWNFAGNMLITKSDCEIREHHLDWRVDNMQHPQNIVDHTLGADQFLHSDCAHQKVGPERNGDQKQPQIAGLGAAGGDEVSRGNTKNCGQDRGYDRQL